MAEITKRRTGELLRKVCEVLAINPEGLPAREAIAEAAKGVPPTEFETAILDSGVRRYDVIIRWATVDAGKAGWLVKSKGRWTLTEAGQAALRTWTDPEKFYSEANRLYAEWRRSTPTNVEAQGTSEAATVEPDQHGRQISRTFEQAEEEAWSEIARFLQAMPPYELQELVADLLRAMGYHVDWIAPPGKDGGMDIVAWSDPLGTRPPRIKVQVKRRSDNTTADGLRSFLAVIGSGDIGLFVTTGGFTKDAQDEARRQLDRRVTLIDLERLFDLWVEFYEKLSDEARRRLPLKPIWFLAPSD